MLASKRKPRLKINRTRKTLKRRRLRVRRNSHFWTLYRRFLLSRVDVLIESAAKKRRIRRFFRQSDRRRQRRQLVTLRIARLSRKLRRYKPRTIRRAGASLTLALRRPLHLTRGKALFTVCRRVRAAIYTHRGFSTRSRATALRLYRRVLRRGRAARGRQLWRPHILRRSLYLLRGGLQLSRSRTRVPRIRVKILRHRAILLANRPNKRGKPRASTRARPWARRRRLLRRASRLKHRRRIIKKYGKKRARRLRRKSGKKREKRVRPCIRRRRVSRVVGNELKLRVFLKRRIGRLSSGVREGLRLWLFLKRATKRAHVRARHAKENWQKHVRKLPRRVPRRKPARIHLKQKRARRRLHTKKRSGMLHKRRRYAARRRAKRRPRPRKRHFRTWIPPVTRRVRRPLMRRFLRRRAARSRAWLRAVLCKTRSSSLRNSLSACVLRPATQSITTRPFRIVDRRVRLLLLRAALRSRMKTYRRKRRALRRRVYLSGARHRLRRQHSRRYLLTFKRSKDFYPERREARRVRRERRKYYGLVQRRGRAWGRWLRLPRRYFSLYLRAIRRTFTNKPRLFDRGSWAYFYRDREFALTHKSQPKPQPAQKLLGVRYPQLRRDIPLRMRSRNYPMWHTSRNAAHRLRDVLIKKNKTVARVLRRRVQTRRYRLSGAVFALKGCAPAHFGFLSQLRKNVFRRRIGRQISRRIPRRESRSVPTRALPLVAQLHPLCSRHLTAAKVSVGSRLSRAFSPRVARKARSNLRFANLKYTPHCYTAELQQSLYSNITIRTRKKRKSVKKVIKPRTRQKDKPSRYRIFARVRLARFWFKQLRYRLVSTRRHIFRILQKRKKRKPHAWRSLLTLLDLEVEVEPALETALEFLDSTDVQIKPQPETEAQDDEAV